MTGSIQVKDGKYYAVINEHINGKRKQIWVNTGYPANRNKKNAERFLRQILSEKEHLEEPNNEQLICDYVNVWLERASMKVRESTHKNYTDLANKHVIPYFKANRLLVTSAKRADIQKFLDAKWKIDELSPRTIKYLATILRQTFKQAVLDEIITISPCTYLDVPKQKKRKPTFFSRKEIDSFLEDVRNDELYPLILITVTYGLRRSEVLGIKWDSIDFEAKTLTIKHTVVQNKKIYELDDTKNETSYRLLILLPEDVQMLSDIKKAEDETRKLLGNSYIDNDYVFKRSDGKTFRPDFVSRKFGQLLKKYGYRNIRFHDLRHTCASLAVSNGVPLKFIQEQLGHADIQTTANTYAHLEHEQKKGAAMEIYKTIRG